MPEIRPIGPKWISACMVILIECGRCLPDLPEFAHWRQTPPDAMGDRVTFCVALEMTALAVADASQRDFLHERAQAYANVMAMYQNKTAEDFGDNEHACAFLAAALTEAGMHQRRLALRKRIGVPESLGTRAEMACALLLSSKVLRRDKLRVNIMDEANQRMLQQQRQRRAK